jgi:hypothetical protein
VLVISDLILKEKWEELIYLHLSLEKIIAKKGHESLDVIHARHMLDIKINEYCQIKK